MPDIVKINSLYFKLSIYDLISCVFFLLDFCDKNECLYLLLEFEIREKDVDITFAQDAIDEYKVFFFLILLYYIIIIIINFF